MLLVEEAAFVRAATREAAEPEEEELDAYTALHPADFQPFTEPGGVKTLIEASAEEAGADKDKG